eukprot:CAMPEP_0194762882 /NCGR_PEP_ID=MMETSP0323_2-20130528/17092_1 /TAXON_ID=2866 ORGANISM="Crypthecodinium cohnii, Strain Seligo" /NCGR_SAMPLE_ID=MMETSP0323_2 /ASSEMBLY_ACC=CAM_ASM_000346 /LENGTH=79 /DNA_ID=CAMNT_0039686295 /DNA_START=111 /DNA_END=347 /DNA_ORIENTATION=+
MTAAQVLLAKGNPSPQLTLGSKNLLAIPNRRDLVSLEEGNNIWSGAIYASPRTREPNITSGMLSAWSGGVILHHCKHVR